MNGSDGLIAFLNARLDEDEASANRGLRFAEDRERSCPDAELVEICDLASRRERNYDQPWWAATVMALRQQVQLAPHDPARVLREVGVLRALGGNPETNRETRPLSAPGHSV